jgi:hypothetical protein
VARDNHKTGLSYEGVEEKRGAVSRLPFNWGREIPAPSQLTG